MESSNNSVLELPTNQPSTAKGAGAVDNQRTKQRKKKNKSIEVATNLARLELGHSAAVRTIALMLPLSTVATLDRPTVSFRVCLLGLIDVVRATIQELIFNAVLPRAESNDAFLALLRYSYYLSSIKLYHAIRSHGNLLSPISTLTVRQAQVYRQALDFKPNPLIFRPIAFYLQCLGWFNHQGQVHVPLAYPRANTPLAIPYVGENFEVVRALLDGGNAIELDMDEGLPAPQAVVHANPPIDRAIEHFRDPMFHGASPTTEASKQFVDRLISTANRKMPHYVAPTDLLAEGSPIQLVAIDTLSGTTEAWSNLALDSHELSTGATYAFGYPLPDHEGPHTRSVIRVQTKVVLSAAVHADVARGLATRKY